MRVDRNGTELVDYRFVRDAWLLVLFKTLGRVDCILQTRHQIAHEILFLWKQVSAADTPAQSHRSKHTHLQHSSYRSAGSYSHLVVEQFLAHSERR